MRQKLAREADHLAVDLNHRDALDITMLQHPAQHAAIAGADNQDVAHVAMRQQRHMGDHFLVDEFVPFGDLNDAVKHHDPSMAGALEDHDILKVAAYAGKFLRDTETLPPIRVQRLIEPLVRHCSPRAAKERPGAPPLDWPR